MSKNARFANVIYWYHLNSIVTVNLLIVRYVYKNGYINTMNVHSAEFKYIFQKKTIDHFCGKTRSLSRTPKHTHNTPICIFISNSKYFEETVIFKDFLGIYSF